MKGKTKFLLKFEDFAYHFLKNVTIRAKIAVALYMSAWIEISARFHAFLYQTSHST